MKAIILAGGFGTRLQSVIKGLPKPMAPVQDKPFLAYLIHYLAEQGFDEAVLSLHYMPETVQNYFQSAYAGVNIQYAVEPFPLGTGGAIVYALKKLTKPGASEPVFILNGDTFVKLDYQAMYSEHIKQQTRLTIALRYVEDCSRYGKVVTVHDEITSFREKGEQGAGWINAGVYLMQPDSFKAFQMPEAFSFENDFLLPHLKEIRPAAFSASDYFIDIGIPEDYARAQAEISSLA